MESTGSIFMGYSAILLDWFSPNHFNKNNFSLYHYVPDVTDQSKITVHQNCISAHAPTALVPPFLTFLSSASLAFLSANIPSTLCLQVFWKFSNNTNRQSAS